MRGHLKWRIVRIWNLLDYLEKVESWKGKKLYEELHLELIAPALTEHKDL